VSFLISHLVIGRIHAYPVRPLHSYVPMRTDTLTMRKTLNSPRARRTMDERDTLHLRW
jgi:hypothetical protein